MSETLEAFSALVNEHATTTTRAATLIASAERSLPTLPIGAGITAFPNDTHCITIHRLIGRPTNSQYGVGQLAQNMEAVRDAASPSLSTPAIDKFIANNTRSPRTGR
jgi:hypothetical protein